MQFIVPDDKAIAIAQKQFLTKDEFPKIVRASKIRTFIQIYGLHNWIYFCYSRALYSYPTVELIELLQGFIDIYVNGDRNKVIEIGTGNTRLFKHLGIRGTDSYCQQIPEIKKYYQTLKRVSTCNRPPEETGIEKIDALDAIAKYQPQLVIGCYITPSWDEELKKGNYWGVDYEKLLRKVPAFLMVGNEIVHEELITKFKYHSKIFDKNIISSSQNQENNCIYFFG